MNRRQKIIISVTGIFLVLLILVGLTYAYFSTQIKGNTENKSITVTTANLILEYGDGNGVIEIDRLEPSNNFITFKDKQGNPVPSKTFTVTNKGNATVEGYKVYLESVQNQLERKDDLVYTLSCKAYSNYGETNQTELETGCNGVETETTFPDVVTSIVTNNIAEGITHFYELKLKYKEMNTDQSIDMNKLITAKVNIYGSGTKFLAREIIDNALNEATVTYNKTNYIDPSLQDGTTYTIPAQEKNKENERVLTNTTDDYGTSYYYRGNVEDNYVNFAGLCWRIVRIEGDGSVKLILEDAYAECNDKETEVTSPVYSGNWSDDKTYAFGYIESTDSYRLDFLNYEGGLADSFKTFQTSKLTSIDIEKLKVDEWCYDNSVSTLANTYAYDVHIRVYKNKKPSLKCTGTKLTKFRDNTEMYVGTLTADEIVLAGANVETNYNYYLMNNYVKNNNLAWWLLSPESFNGNWDFGIVMYSYGGMHYDAVMNNSSNSSRPAVTLKSVSTIVDGNGTQEKPYVIE